MKLTVPIIFITVATASGIYIRNHYRRREIDELARIIREMILRYNGPDPYGRDVDNKAIQKMAEISYDRMNLTSNDTITDGIFDEIYKQYILYKMNEAKKIFDNNNDDF
jgi:hypothetical protein